MTHTKQRDDGGSPQWRLLIVEDEFLIALTAEEALRDEGFQVVGVAATYDEAVALAGETRPDLVLMDIKLASRRDGIEAAIEIRERFDIPILFTSANQDAHNVERARPAKPVGWIPKPYAIERLVQAVTEILCSPGAAVGP